MSLIRCFRLYLNEKTISGSETVEFRVGFEALGLLQSYRVWARANGYRVE